MPRFENCIFDVDGTLIDPLIGITTSMRYAFDKLDIEYLPEFDQGIFIGPPLQDTLSEVLPSKELVDLAIAHYREHFSTIGYKLCTLYSGIPELLSDLSRSYNLYVATSRVQYLAELLMHHFELAGHFTRIYGTGLNGEFYDKALLLQHVCNEYELDPAKTVMVGDRKYDVKAGKASNMLTVGVTYGYGPLEELHDAGADHISRSVAELRDYLVQ